MRGQVNFLFVFSAILFIGLIVYVVLVLLNFSDTYTTVPQQELQRMHALQLSDILISTTGKWENQISGEQGEDWEAHPELVTSIGLASSYHSLSQDKISALSGLPDSKLREIYGNNTGYSICIREPGSSGCNILGHTNNTVRGQMVTRYAHYVNRSVEVLVGVW